MDKSQENLLNEIVDKYTLKMEEKEIIEQANLNESELLDWQREIHNTNLEINNMMLERQKIINKTNADMMSGYTFEKKELQDIMATRTNLNDVLNAHQHMVTKKSLEDAKKLYKQQTEDNNEVAEQLNRRERDIYILAYNNNRNLTTGEMLDIKEIEKLRKESESVIFDEKSKNLEKLMKKQDDWVKRSEKVITEIFKVANNMFDYMVTNNIKTALSNLASTYEQNFTDIAGRLGSTNSRIETHQFIETALHVVNDDPALKGGLNFNREVFPLLTDAVKQGFQGEEATSWAITSAVDKKILPALDNSSELWTKFHMHFSEDTLAQLKGQQLLLQESRAGNRLLQTGVINSITDQLAPTLYNIELNTTDDSNLTTDFAARYQAIMDTEQYSHQDAMRIVNQEMKAYQNPGEMLLNSGASVADIMMAIGSIENGTQGIRDAQTFLYEQPIGGDSIAVAALYNTLGLISNGQTRDDSGAQAMIAAGGELFDYYQNEFRNNPEEAMAAYEERRNNLEQVVTATQEHDNEAQNQATEFYFPQNLRIHGMEFQEQILNEVVDIKNWLVGFASEKVADWVGKGVGNLFNKAAGQSIFGTSSVTGGSLMPGGLAAGNTLGGTLTNIGGGSAGLGGLAVAAPLAVGGYGLYRGIKEGKEDFETGHEVRGTANILGGLAMGAGGIGVAGGMLAAGAANAWNPLGWSLLIGGALTLTATAIHKQTEQLDIVGQEYTNVLENYKSVSEENYKIRLDELSNLRTTIGQMEDEQEIRQTLIDNGFSKFDVQLATSKEELMQLGLEAISTSTRLKLIGDTTFENLTNFLSENSAQDSDTAKNNLNEYFQNQLIHYDENQRHNYITQEQDSEIFANMRAELEMFANSIKDEEKQKTFRKDVAYKFDDGKISQHEIDSIIKGSALFDMKGLFNQTSLDMESMSHFGETIGVDLFSDVVENKQALTDMMSIYQNWSYARDVETKKKLKNEMKLTYDDLIELHPDKKTEIRSYVKKPFEEMGFEPNEFSKGAEFIPYDQLAYVHKGEKIVTEHETTTQAEQLNSNNTNAIVEAIHELLNAIHGQTRDLSSGLSNINNNSSSETIMNMRPTIGLARTY